MTNSAPKTIGITILNWNGIADTLECIESLQALDYSNYRIFILDNGSTDDSADCLGELGDSITLLTSKTNHGFAGGMNKITSAAIESGVDFIFLLNNDTIVTPDCISRLLLSYQQLDNVNAIVAPVSHRDDDPREIDHAGHYWDTNKCRFRPAHKTPQWQPHSLNEVDHIVASAVLVPSHIIREHGLFDERFFLNYEETDWEFRLRRAGIRLYIEPRATICHKVSRSFVTAQKAYYLERNRLLWIRKNFSGAEKWRVWRKMAIPRIFKISNRIATKTIACAALRLTGQREKLRRMQKRLLRNRMAMRGMISYFRDEFGPAPTNLPFNSNARFSTKCHDKTANSSVNVDA